MSDTNDNAIKNESNFHLSRIAFAIINDKLRFTMFDKRDHKTWLKEVYNISDKEFEDIVRGYIRDGRVFFYKTSQFKDVPMKEISTDALRHIRMLGMVYMNTSELDCYNGMIIGKVGEEWKPRQSLGSLDTLISHRETALV